MIRMKRQRYNEQEWKVGVAVYYIVGDGGLWSGFIKTLYLCTSEMQWRNITMKALAVAGRNLILLLPDASGKK